MTLSGRFARPLESNMRVYLCVMEPVLHPETCNPILAVGDLITPTYLLDLNARMGINNIKVEAIVAEDVKEAANVAYAP